ncbi:MAG: BolA family transcriptional regulator, partial [Pseudomonadales bacterium]
GGGGGGGGGGHALALHCYTPQQWATKQGMPAAPNCLGGSKSDQ